MKTNTNPNRRALLQGLGAASSTLVIPSLALANDDAKATNTATTSEAAQPELEKYGIRQFAAPELLLDYWIDENGKPTEFSVHAQKGKWLFMKFFQNWCPGCHKFGFPTLKKFADEFYDHPDVETIAVQTVFEGFSVNSKSAVRELQLRYDLPITMGHDPGTKLTENHPLSMINYRTGGTPWLILVAPDGHVVFNDFHVDSDALVDFVKKAVA